MIESVWGYRNRNPCDSEELFSSHFWWCALNLHSQIAPNVPPLLHETGLVSRVSMVYILAVIRAALAQEGTHRNLRRNNVGITSEETEEQDRNFDAVCMATFQVDYKLWL